MNGATASDLVARAELLKRQSRLRLRVFGAKASVFRDPAWEMLLEAYVADARSTPIPVKSVAIASGVPPTTALRWMGSLQEAGLVRKVANGKDRRSTLVQLTDSGRTLVGEYLEASDLFHRDAAENADP